MNRIFFISTILLALAVSGCSKAPAGVEFHDPNERANRRMHDFNKNVDKALLRPASKAYGAVFNEHDDKIINNFVENTSLPSRAMNYLLQGRIDSFLETTARFIFNTTFGIGGIFDPSTNFGLPNRSTDFGETLYVWGVDEGPYVELPLFGGRTDRDAIGLGVDLILDPLSTFLPARGSQITRMAKGVEIVADRHIYSEVVDGVLYESDDSYAALRQFTLQNRRFKLGGEVSTSELEDPFADE